MNQKIEQAKKVCLLERRTMELENKKQQIWADLWLNTNFEERLEKKRATEEDKKSFIRISDEYMNIVSELAKTKALKNYEQNILQIMMTDE